MEDVKIIKPETDDRQYSLLKLENDLLALVVSDPKSEKSSAAMGVEVGHFQNKKVEGLAHFLEHMLFMGSKKYPNENEFMDFITKNNGNTNAFTSSSETVYYYEVNAKSLEKSIEIFSGFFTRPLLKEDCVERELKAVHSEHEKNISQDNWRIKQILKNYANEEHPFSNFSTGCNETLKIDGIREKVKSFFEEEYSANLMKLVIIGTENIETLKGYVRKYFSNVKNKAKERGVVKVSPFNDKYKFKIFNVVPVKDEKKLKFFFPIEYNAKEEYKNDASKLLSHLLGHEGDGSLYVCLKKKLWVTSLLAGKFYDVNGYVYFGVEVDLTDLGESHVSEIIVSFYEYVEMLKKSSVEERKNLFLECQQITKIGFDIKDKIKGYYYVPGLVQAMRKYQPEDVLCGGYFYFQFNSEKFDRILEKFLVPENMITMVVSKKFEQKTDLVEKWYKTPHSITEIDKELIDKTKNPKKNEEFFFPERNVFAPKDLSLKKVEKDSEYPYCIYKTDKVECYYKQDNRFRRPRSSYILSFYFVEPFANVISCFSTVLLGELIKDSVNEYTYYAEVCFFSFLVKGDKYGFLFKVSGFNDTIQILINKIIERMFNFEKHLKIERFNVIKQDMVRKYKNMRQMLPAYQAIYHSSYILNATREYHYENHVEKGCEVTFEQILQFYKNLRSIRVNVLVMGNNTEDDVKDAIKNVEKIIKVDKKTPILKSEKPIKRIVKLKKGKQYVFRMKSLIKGDSNNSLVCNIQITLRDMLHDIYLDILKILITGPLFDTLRNKEQIGYLVGSRIFKFHNVQYFQFYLMSAVKNPLEIHERVLKFVEEFKQEHLMKLTEESFEKTKDSLVKRYSEKYKRLDEELLVCWDEIESEQYRFSRKNDMVEAIKKIKKNDFMEFFEKYFIKQRTTFSVHLFCDKSVELMGKNKEGVIYVDDPHAFKLTMPAFPSFKKY